MFSIVENRENYPLDYERYVSANARWIVEEIVTEIDMSLLRIAFVAKCKLFYGRMIELTRKIKKNIKMQRHRHSGELWFRGIIYNTPNILDN